ncbi:MAG: hypothetical protein J6S67_08090 [Methanobrevibacter sp.]|nr:hypothetical protein [Methanobrevibacter sp.]
MTVNFDAVFVEEEPFTAEFTSSEEITADIQRLYNVAHTTATANDVVEGKIFVDKDGIETTGTYIWDFKGFRPVLINPDVYSITKKLSETNFATWTPSSTASAIIASVTVGTFVADLANYEYLIHWSCSFDGVYPSGTTMKAATTVEIGDIWQSIFRRPNSIANLHAENYNSNACITLSTTPLCIYYNASGTLGYTYSISYGIYPSATAATFSSSTSLTPTVTIKSPAYNARCSTTYFSTARAGDIDQDESIIKIKGELWRVPIGAVTRSLYESLINLYNNH